MSGLFNANTGKFILLKVMAGAQRRKRNIIAPPNLNLNCNFRYFIGKICFRDKRGSLSHVCAARLASTLVYRKIYD